MKTKVFVTDGIAPSSPSVIESLASHGYEVHCGEEFYWNASFFSRYTNKAVIYPSPEKKPDDFISFLSDYLEKHNIEYLIPLRCSSIETILLNKERLPRSVKYLLPDYQNWLKAEFKHQTLSIAADINFPMPKTIFKMNIDYKMVKEQLGETFIVKVSRSSGARGIITIKSEDEFNRIQTKLLSDSTPFVYQEWIPAGGRSFNASYLFDQNGIPVTGFLMEKIRQYPMKGGSTSFAKGIKNEKLLSRGRELLKKLDWKGVAEIEYIQDPRDGEYKLMEINPRFWNPTLLAIKSGIDYPKHIMDILEEGNLIFPEDYRTDISFSFFPYELLNFVNSFDFRALRPLFPFGKNIDVFFKLHDLPLFFGFIAQSLFLLINKRKEFVNREYLNSNSGKKDDKAYK